jgi:hypothetical protein
MPDRYPDQYGSLGPHVYSGPPMPDRYQYGSPGPQVYSGPPMPDRYQYGLPGPQVYSGPPLPDRYPDQYGSLGPHVYSGQAPPPIPERDPGPYVAPSPGFYPPPLVRPQLTRLRPRHKHDKRRVETPSMKSGPPPSAASIIPAIKSEPPPSIKSGPSPSTASSTAPSLAAPATQAPRDQTRPAVFAPRGRARIDPGLKSGPNHVAFKGDAARKLAAQFASACRNAHRIVAECPCLAGQGVASPQSSTGYPAF